MSYYFAVLNNYMSRRARIADSHNGRFRSMKIMLTAVMVSPLYIYALTPHRLKARARLSQWAVVTPGLNKTLNGKRAIRQKKP